MEYFNLENRPKIKQGFKVPENYFETFTDKLMQQLPEHEVKVVPLFKRKPVWMTAIAAVFVIALTLGIFFQMNTETVVADDTAAIENYLVYNTNLTSYDYMQMLDEQDIAELESSVTLSDEAIEDYLSTENIYINE
jgi:hypothetical protein